MGGLAGPPHSHPTPQGGDNQAAPGPALATTPTTCPSLARLWQQTMMPTPCLQPLVLVSRSLGRAEPPLPPWRCFFPLGGMSPCSCGASRSDAPLSNSRLSFVQRINPTRLAILRINPEHLEQPRFPSSAFPALVLPAGGKASSKLRNWEPEVEAGSRAGGRAASRQE